MEQHQCGESAPSKNRASKINSFGKTFSAIFKMHVGILLALLSAIAMTIEDILLSIAGQILHPLAVLIWNAVCVTLFTSVVLLFIQPPFPADVRTILWLVVGGLLCGSGAMLCTLGTIMSTPGDAVALFYTLPVITALLQIIIRKEQVTLAKCFLALSSASGAIPVAQPSFLFHGSPIKDTDKRVGIIISALSPFVFSIGMIIIAKRKIHSLYTLLVFTLSEIPLLIILCSFVHVPVFPEKLANTVFMILVALEYFLGYMLFFAALTIEETSTVSIIMTSEVVLVSLAQCVFLTIPLDWKSTFGSFIITATCAATFLSDVEKKQVNGNHEEKSEEGEKLVANQK